MNIGKNIHQIRIDFQVTETVQRYVYMYLITGKHCYLIDSGIAGSEQKLQAYMTQIGRSMEEIKAIFLTHAHPDHIGGAAAIQRISNCKIYALAKEKHWIEDIHTQFAERPIPNFYTLVNQSVSVDIELNGKELIMLEDDISLQALQTGGHSMGDVSYFYREKRILFSGDAIPQEADFPILVDVRKSITTLEQMQRMDIHCCCPAWERIYTASEWKDVLQNRKDLLQKFLDCVRWAEANASNLSEDERLQLIAERMGYPKSAINPLFRRSVRACLAVL